MPQNSKNQAWQGLRAKENHVSIKLSLRGYNK